MTLGEKQRLFVRLIGKLIEWTYAQGYELTFGESFDDDNIGHMRNSLHYVRLAQDLNLFKDGKWLQKSEDHGPLGAYWKTLNPLCRWGGDWNDGNHYSLAHEGRS
jgi:hypothetical protein